MSGELPIVDAELMVMTLSGTPDMVELLTAGDPTVFAKSIESMIIEYMYISFERNVPQKWMSAETAWSSMNGSLGLHSVHIWVTCPSVKMSFMNSQSLSQSPKYL